MQLIYQKFTYLGRYGNISETDWSLNACNPPHIFKNLNLKDDGS